MRVNIRKFIIIGVCVISAWFLFSYTSYFLVSKDNPKKSLVELEIRLEKLQEQLNNDINDSNKLLNQMKHFKRDNVKQVVNEVDNNSIDIKSKYIFSWSIPLCSINSTKYE